MACGICSGVLDNCPVCGITKNPTHLSWEERLNARRHQGSHVTPYQANSAAKPIRQGRYVIDNGGFHPGPKYSRSFNSKYDGPGKGTW